MTGDALVCATEAPSPGPTSGGSCGEPAAWLWPSLGKLAASRRRPCSPEARRAGSENLGQEALAARAPLSRGAWLPLPLWEPRTTGWSPRPRGPGCGGSRTSRPSASRSRVRGAGPAWTSACSSSARPPSSLTPGGRGGMEGWAVRPPGRGSPVKMLLSREPSLGTSGSPWEEHWPAAQGSGSLNGLPEPRSAPCGRVGTLRVLGAPPGVVEGVAASRRGPGLAVLGPSPPHPDNLGSIVLLWVVCGHRLPSPDLAGGDRLILGDRGSHGRECLDPRSSQAGTSLSFASDPFGPRLRVLPLPLTPPQVSPPLRSQGAFNPAGLPGIPGSSPPAPGGPSSSRISHVPQRGSSDSVLG